MSKDEAATMVVKIKDLLKEAIEGDRLLWANEITANLQSEFVMVFLVCLQAITIFCNQTGIFSMDPDVINPLFSLNILMLCIGIFLLYYHKGARHWLKVMAMGMICTTICGCCSYLGYRATLAYCVPVVLSTRYLNRKFTRGTCILCSLLFVLSSVFYCFIGLTPDMNVVVLPQGTELFVNGPVDQALKVSDLDRMQYVFSMLKDEVLMNFLIFCIISFISCEVAHLGYKMMVEQKNITASHAAIDTELNVAKQIQEHALPNVCELQTYDCFELAASMTPAKEIGGDFYDFMMVDDTHLALVIADVSGKGVPAAMYMMVCKMLLNQSIAQGKGPGKILTEVNHQLCQKNRDDMFVTVWLGILDLETGKMTTANAGHEYPVICRKNGNFSLYKDVHGLVLGGMDGIRYREDTIQLKPGDSLFVYTDGVTEAKSMDGRFYGTDQLITQLNMFGTSDITEMVKHMKEELNSFQGENHQFDDITMLGFRLRHLLNADGIATEPKEESISDVEAYLEEQMEQAGVNIKTMNRVNIAIDEIYSNIVFYSNATSVRIQCRITEEKVVIIFSDNGIPYNPLNRKEADITSDAEHRKEGGLGILLTRKMMDDVAYNYENSRNVIILTKYRN